jgi:hypothetical protein
MPQSLPSTVIRLMGSNAMFGPFRGRDLRLFAPPGRCPGLPCDCPFGANSKKGNFKMFALGQVLLLVFLSGCGSELYNQPKYKTFAASDFFDDGSSARPLVAGTVPRGDPRERGQASEELFTTGKTAGKLAVEIPFHVDRSVLERGQERYRIFCTPCHSELGDGQGMIVRRGFNPPPSFHKDELRKEPIGHFFDVMTRGHGTMYSYAWRIPPRDRWAIAAYIRALQLSQHALAADLTSEDRSQLEGARP